MFYCIFSVTGGHGGRGGKVQGGEYCLLVIITTNYFHCFSYFGFGKQCETKLYVSGWSGGGGRGARGGQGGGWRGVRGPGRGGGQRGNPFRGDYNQRTVYYS